MSFKNWIMSKDRYPSIFSHQMEALVFIVLLSEHYLFREVNCELRGTENVQRQISEHISHQMEALVLIVLLTSFAARAFFLKIGEYSVIPQFYSWEIFGHLTW